MAKALMRCWHPAPALRVRPCTTLFFVFVGWGCFDHNMICKKTHHKKKHFEGIISFRCYDSSQNDSLFPYLESRELYKRSMKHPSNNTRNQEGKKHCRNIEGKSLFWLQSRHKTNHKKVTHKWSLIRTITTSWILMPNISQD